MKIFILKPSSLGDVVQALPVLRLLKKSLPLDDILVCPHDEADHCPCRKPQDGLLLEAAFKWHIDLDRSYVISDKWQDAHAAHVAGCTSLLLRSPWIGKGHQDFVLSNLSEVVEKIMVTEGAIRRLLEPEEVAHLVTYLCSDAASGITGSAQVIDCGWTAH